MPPRRPRVGCPYCGDDLVQVHGALACDSGCPVVSCPRCGASMAPFLNPDGTVPPGPRACAHLAVVAPAHDAAAVPDLGHATMAPPPALPRAVAMRPVPEALRRAAFGDRAPILAAWRRLTTRPGAADVLHAIVAFRHLDDAVTVVHPAGDAADVGAVAFAADAGRTREAILADAAAIEAGFRDLAARLAGRT